MTKASARSLRQEEKKMKEKEMLVLPDSIKRTGDGLISIKTQQGHLMLKEWQAEQII